MKRFIICAAAAIVALASCSKTQVVYNDAPEEIGFKAISGVMTKDPVLGQTFPGGQPITVTAYNNANKESYFTETVFAKDNVSKNWEAATPEYYPTTGSLDFVAYTDDATNGVVSVTLTDNGTHTYTLADNSSVQHDFMVSNYVVDKGKTDPAAAVGIAFSHALALIEVNVACTGADVTVNSVTLTGTKQAGQVTVTYTDADNAVADVAPSVGAWFPSGDAESLIEDTPQNLTAGGVAVKFADFLVVPESETDKTLVVNYTLNNNTFNHEIELDAYQNATTWAFGTKYIFNVTIGLQEITFNPTVAGTGWTPANAGNPTI